MIAFEAKISFFACLMLGFVFASSKTDCLANPSSDLSSSKASIKNGRVDNNPLRIQTAKQIIEENRQIIKQSSLLIAQAQEQEREVKKLEGEARSYQKKLLIKAPLLKGKSLSDARKQYKLDLYDFAKHVRKYNLHTLEVRKNLGQCKASLAAYEKMKKDLALHCDQFHMTDIEPPHICVTMDMSVQDAKSAQNKVQQEAIRVANAEMELAKTEKRLQKSISERGIIDGEVMQKSALALKEQELAAEFGRLKEEHRQLDVERQVLARSGAKVGVPSVKARVKR